MAEILLDVDADHPGEECGVLGIRLDESGIEAVHSGEIGIYRLAYDALVSQKNRGQQNTGLASSIDGYHFDRIVERGGPEEAFEEGALLNYLPDNPQYLLGHNRYTTVGGKDGGQPIEFSNMVMVGNGELSNHQSLVEASTREGLPSDYWVLGSIIADEIDEGFTLPAAMIRAANISEGAYSIVSMHDQQMVAMRDPHGVRPLHYTHVQDFGWAVASERPTLQVLGAELSDIQEVNPGELLVFNEEGVHNFQFAETTTALCALEKIYLLSTLDRSLYKERYESGRIMAQENPAVDADVVVPILGSAKAGSQGYADELDLPMLEAVVKRKGSKRNFMEEQAQRDLGRFPKHDIHIDKLAGKKVVLVDDSVVRGDTLLGIASQVAEVAEEVHIVILSPKIVDICNLGVAIKDKHELIAHKMSGEAFVQLMDDENDTIKSYAHLTLDGLFKAYGKDLCTGCLGGEYPVAQPTINKNALNMLSASKI